MAEEIEAIEHFGIACMPADYRFFFDFRKLFKLSSGFIWLDRFSIFIITPSKNV